MFNEVRCNYYVMFYLDTLKRGIVRIIYLYIADLSGLCI